MEKYHGTFHAYHTRNPKRKRTNADGTRQCPITGRYHRDCKICVSMANHKRQQWLGVSGCGTPSSKKGLPPCNPATPQPSRDRAAATAEPRPRPPRRLLQPSSRRGEAPRRAVERKLMKFASQRSAAAPRAELPSLHYQPSAVPLIVSGLRRATLSPVRSLWSRALPCDLLASLWCV